MPVNRDAGARAAMGASPRRGLVLSFLVPALLVLGGCFRPPVVERLTLTFLPDGRVRVAVSHAIAMPVMKESDALAARLEETRRALLEGRDPWGRCFDAVKAAEETLRWEKQGGYLARHERSAVLAAPGDLREFFARTPLQAVFRKRDGTAEFAVFPAAVTRATREQKERVTRELSAWSGMVAAYLGQAVPLFEYLQRNPDRAAPCFGKLFGDLLAGEARRALPALTAGEEERLQRVEEAMGGVLSVLRVKEGEAYTPDELSRMVFSPFPSEFVVEAPAAFLEVEGFERTGERTARVPAHGLWEAYAAVRGRWLDPDPLQAYLAGSLRREEGEESGLDLAAFSAITRTAVAIPPGADEVLSVLRQALTPAEVYRIVWLVPEAGEDPSPPFE